MVDEVISLRVGEDLKRRMKMLDHINWSAIVRKALEEQLTEEKIFDEQKAKKASKEIDKLRDSGAFRKGSKTGAEIIREWRGKRN